MNTTETAQTPRSELRALVTATAGSILDGIPVVSAVFGGAAAFRVVNDHSGRFPAALAAGLGAAITTYGVVESLVDARRSELYRASRTMFDTAEVLPANEVQMLARLQSAAVHAARRNAATHAASLDSGKKLLTNEQLWHGYADGTATAELPGGTTLTYRPAPVPEHGYVRHTYFLTLPGEDELAEIRTMAELVRMVEQARTGPNGARATPASADTAAEEDETGAGNVADSPPWETGLRADGDGHEVPPELASAPSDERLFGSRTGPRPAA